jgi:DnaJ-class molecular chaperone
MSGGQKSKNKQMKKKCKKCGSTGKKVKLYVIADDIENPQPYCDKCWEKFKIEVIIKLGELKS